MAWLVSSFQMITVLLIVQLTLVPAAAQQAYEVAADEVDAIYYIRSTEFVDFNVKSTDTGDQRRQQYAVVVVVPHGEPVKKTSTRRLQSRRTTWSICGRRYS